jgi:signal transduction histidine kinase
METVESRILVVDDEPDMEFLIKQKFRKKIKDGSIKFSFATNGREALEILNKDDYDLVLTDINMPEMDGLTLLDHIKNLHKMLKTVVVSAYGDFANIRTAMNRGAFDFVTKPIDFTDLDTTINKTLDELKNLKEGLKAKKDLKVSLEEKEWAILEKDKSDQSRKFKEQFLANMSHEIRTPLNAVIGMTNLVMNTNLNDQQKKYINSIKKASQNLLVIINDVLDISKIEAGRMELENINFSLKETLNTLYETLHYKAEEKNISFNVILNEHPDIVSGDPVRLAQILINVASNAIKFTDKGAVVVTYKLIKSDNNNVIVEFKIKDSGIGMNAEELGNVFDSFSQANSSTTRKYGGTGLGLTITRQLINLHNGSISVKSEVGKGSEFTITLPFEIYKGIPEPQLNHPLYRTEDVGEIKILLVEDNIFNQIVAVDTIKNIFPAVIVDIAENGHYALEKIHSKVYDLVLMDIQMPEMDGYTATRKIRENESTIALPIIAMTANAIKEEVDKCFECGMNDYIAKPFEPVQLANVIMKVLYNAKIY